MATSPPRLLCWDLETCTRSTTSTPHISRLRTACLSRDGSWLAIAHEARDEIVLQAYALHQPLAPVLHLDGIDLRGRTSPMARMHRAAVSLCHGMLDGSLFVLMSRHGDEAATWPGWRGSVACVELETGVTRWHAEIDAELTGDWRGAMDLGRDAAFAPALCCHEERLWVGGWDASVLELDARDGALRHAHYHAGVHACAAMHHDAQHGELVMMDERGHVSALVV